MSVYPAIRSLRGSVTRLICILLCLLLLQATPASGADGKATLAKLEKIIFASDLPGGGKVVKRYASDRYPDASLEFETPSRAVIRAQLSERTAASNKQWFGEAWDSLKNKPKAKARQITLGDGCMVYMYTSVAIGDVIQDEWRISVRVVPGPDRRINTMDLAIALLQKMHERFQGPPAIFDIPEVRTFLGKDDPKTDSRTWNANLQGWTNALGKRVLEFPGIDLSGTISREGLYDWQLYLPGSAIFELIGKSNRPSTMRSANVYARATAPHEVRLRAKILEWKGRPLEPADVMLWALQVTNGNYRLATITVHNLLKEVTFLGREAVMQAQQDRQQSPKVFEKRLADGTYTNILREQNRIVTRLVSLRADPDAANDKMGPWYHIFAVLSAGSISGAKYAQEVVGLEHGMKWLSGFVNEAGFNREKYTIDEAFARVAQKLDSSLSAAAGRAVLRLNVDTQAQVEKLRQDPQYRKFVADLLENAAPDQREKIRKQLDDPLFQYEVLCRLNLLKRTPQAAASSSQNQTTPHGGSYLGVLLGEPLQVREVLDGSPAARADLRKGDLIYSTQKGLTSDVAAFAKMVSSLQPDEVLGLAVCRGREEFLTVVALAAKDPSGQNQRLGVGLGQALVVVNVIVGSPAAQAGLKRYDQILAVNGEKVERRKDLLEKTAAVAPGSRMVLQVWRDGRTEEYPLVTGKPPDEGAQPEMLHRGLETYCAFDYGAGFSVRMPYDVPLLVVRPMLIASRPPKDGLILIQTGVTPAKAGTTMEARFAQALELNQAQQRTLQRVRDGSIQMDDGTTARWVEVNLNYQNCDYTALVYDIQKGDRGYLWFALVPKNDFAKHRERFMTLAQTFRIHNTR